MYVLYDNSYRVVVTLLTTPPDKSGGYAHYTPTAYHYPAIVRFSDGDFSIRGLSFFIHSLLSLPHDSYRVVLKVATTIGRSALQLCLQRIVD